MSSSTSDSDSPYTAPQVTAARKRLTILNRLRFVMPEGCVVCGGEATTEETYNLRFYNITYVDVTVREPDWVTVHYCEKHARSYRRRYRCYDILRAFLFGVSLILVPLATIVLVHSRYWPMLGLADPATDFALGEHDGTKFYAGVAAGIACILSFGICYLLFRWCLFDLYVRKTAGRMRLRGSASFIQRAAEANKGNVRAD